MRFLYLVVDDLNADAQELKRLTEVGKRRVGPQNEFEVQVIPIGPGYFYESSVGATLAAPGVLAATLTASDPGRDVDAVLLGCMTDPGLDAARSITDLRVLGTGGSSIELAGLLASSYGVVTIMESAIPELWKLVNRTSSAATCVGMSSIEIPFNELHKQTDLVLDRVTQESHLLLEHGAEAIVLGCASFGFVPVAEPLSKALGVPVIDPLRAAIACARAQETLAMGPSRRLIPLVQDTRQVEGYLRQLVQASDQHRLHGWTHQTSPVETAT